MTFMPDRRPFACALRYRPEEHAAPCVTATGRGRLAERIIKMAREAGVPIREDAGLADLLKTLDAFQEIPQELYKPVAVLLAAVYRAGGKSVSELAE